MSALTLAALTFCGLIAFLGGLRKYQDLVEMFPDDAQARAAPHPLHLDGTLLATDTIHDTSSRSERAVDGHRKDLFEAVLSAWREIIEFLKTDWNPGVKPSGGISWIALGVSFFLLSPILIPLILSPLILVLLIVASTQFSNVES